MIAIAISRESRFYQSPTPPNPACGDCDDDFPYCGHYILDGKKPVKCPDLMKFARSFEDNDDARTVACEDIEGVTVSTVFLGIDHNFHGDGPPILFETLVFGGCRDGFQFRSETWELAEVAHDHVVILVRMSQTVRGRIYFWTRGMWRMFKQKVATSYFAIRSMLRW